MAEKKERKEVVNAYIIPTFKLPLIKRIGRKYPLYRALFWLCLTSLVLLPFMAANEWDLIILAYFSPALILCLAMLVSSLFSFTYMTKYNNWRERAKHNPSHATIDTGAPGTGKSMLAKEETAAMAAGSWEKIKEEFWFLLRRMKKPDYVLTESDKEVKEAFEFYISHEGIPCLATNIPAWSESYRRFSYKFLPAHLKQEKRCPYRLVGWYDEIGTVFNPDLHLDKQNLMNSEEISDMARYPRHFCELRFVGTEQEGSNIYKNVRRVVGSQRLMLETKPVLKPLILMWIYKKLMNHFTNRMSEKEAKSFGRFMELYRDFLANVGFFRLRYRTIMTCETGVLDVTEKKNGNVVYVPCACEIVYVSRAFKNAYKAKDKPLDLEVYNSLELDEREALEFLRATSFYRKQAAKEEKERQKQEKKIA